MKKILLSILTVLMLILCGLSVWKGLGLLGIVGLEQIQEKNTEIGTTVEEVTRLASTDYENTLETIKNSTKKLEEEKKSYEDLMATVSVKNEDGKVVAQSQKYEIEYLWAVVGNHAKSEGVEIKMDLVAGIGQNKYNLNFTIRGSYIGISDFIYSIENDTVLGFKVENFKLVPGGSTEMLEGTFTCKNIEIENVSNTLASPTDTNVVQNGNNTTNTTGQTTTTQNTTVTTNNSGNNTTNTVQNIQ